MFGIYDGNRGETKARLSICLRPFGSADVNGAAIREIQDFFPQILNGRDPFGDYFVESVSPGNRPLFGATRKPAWLIDLGKTL